MSIDSRIPHSLRLVIFFLRLALGLDFFYLGFSSLFNSSLTPELRSRSIPSLYIWIATHTNIAWLYPFAEWAFLIIGACLILGFLTRLSSIVGIVLTAISFWPALVSAQLSVSTFVNDELLVIICLLILIFAHAGHYIGADKLFRWRSKK